LAVYPILSLARHNLSVGDCLARIQAGIAGALAALRIASQTMAGRHGLWGRTGQLAALGVAVRHWVTYHGAFLNVCPRMGLFRLVDSDPEHHSRMSCLVAERGRPVRMTSVRAEVVRHLAEALGCDRYHLHTGHPWLPASRCPTR
jgi:lipoate-protein ligase B